MTNAEMPDDMRLLFELHEPLARQGPGSEAATLLALAKIPPPGAKMRILDIGCGAGAQTVTLAQHLAGHITAVDIFPAFLHLLQKRIENTRTKATVETQVASMDALEFPDGSFDLIWSEGAIYIMGFEKGLRQWRRLLKPGCHMAVSELSWLSSEPPAEVCRFWKHEYPGMADITVNLERIRSAGYTPIHHFTLPEEAWWDTYYEPLRQRIQTFRTQYADSAEAQHLCDATEYEMDLYRRYAPCYGYVFYIMRLACVAP